MVAEQARLQSGIDSSVTVLLFLLAMQLLLQAQPAAASRTLNLGTSYALDLPPYQFIDRCSQQPTGTTIHLLSKIAQKLDTQFTIQYVTTFDKTNMLVNMLQQGELQGLFSLPVNLLSMPGLTIKSIISHSPVNIYKGSIIINKAMYKDIQSLEDLAGTTAGVIGSSINNKRMMAELGKHSISAVDIANTNIALTRLLNQEVDFVMIDPFYAQIKQSQEKFQGHFYIVRSPALDRAAHLFYNANNTSSELIAAIDKELQQAHQTGTYERLNDYYLKIWLNRKGCINSREDDLENLRFINIENQPPEKKSLSNPATASAL